MAVIALSSSASGLTALSTDLDVIANNLANLNTTGFKRSRLNFQDLMYIERKQPGVQNLNGDERPMGLYVGLGVEASGTQKNFTPGAAQSTGNELDVMIQGRGFFQFRVESDLAQNGIAYSRAGNLAKNSDGDLVLATDTGRVLEPQITIPPDATSVSIGPDGKVSVIVSGQVDPQEIGQIELATFVNPAGLKEVGENLFVPTAASGNVITAIPGQDGSGFLQQKFLEASNVEPTKELVDLIRTQRAFELNGQVLRAADETLRQINALRRQ